MRVVVHGVAVGHGSHLVLQHLLMDAKVGIRVEVVVLGGHLVDRQLGLDSTAGAAIFMFAVAVLGDAILPSPKQSISPPCPANQRGQE